MGGKSKFAIESKRSVEKGEPTASTATHYRQRATNRIPAAHQIMKSQRSAVLQCALNPKGWPTLVAIVFLCICPPCSADFMIQRPDACTSCDKVPCGYCQQGCSPSPCAPEEGSVRPTATSRNGCPNMNAGQYPPHCNTQCASCDAVPCGYCQHGCPDNGASCKKITNFDRTIVGLGTKNQCANANANQFPPACNVLCHLCELVPCGFCQEGCPEESCTPEYGSQRPYATARNMCAGKSVVPWEVPNGVGTWVDNWSWSPPFCLTGTCSVKDCPADGKLTTHGKYQCCRHMENGEMKICCDRQAWNDGEITEAPIALPTPPPKEAVVEDNSPAAPPAKGAVVQAPPQSSAPPPKGRRLLTAPDAPTDAPPNGRTGAHTTARRIEPFDDKPYEDEHEGL